MNSIHSIIILIAVVIGLIYLIIIRNYDTYEKEPFLKLLLVAVFGGIISIVTSLILYKFVDVKYNFIDAIIKVGPIEETSKLLALVLLYRFIKSEFNEIVDGLVYIAAISLGFAVIENVFYAYNSEYPFAILFGRSIVTVIGHISFSGYLGLAFYIHTNIKRNILGIILAVIIASLAHGLYDAVLFQKELVLFFQFVYVGIVSLQIILFKLVAGFSKFREDLTLELFEPTGKIAFLRCGNCNNTIKDNEIKFRHIHGVLCQNCDSLVLQGSNIKALFRYFRPSLRVRRYVNKLFRKRTMGYLDENEKVSYNWQRKILSSRIPDLAEWLNNSNKSDRKRILQIPIIGIILYFIGMRHLEPYGVDFKSQIQKKES